MGLCSIDIWAREAKKVLYGPATTLPHYVSTNDGISLNKVEQRKKKKKQREKRKKKQGEDLGMLSRKETSCEMREGNRFRPLLKGASGGSVRGSSVFEEGSTSHVVKGSTKSTKG